jgi:hypothetical protein
LPGDTVALHVSSDVAGQLGSGASYTWTLLGTPNVPLSGNTSTINYTIPATASGPLSFAAWGTSVNGVVLEGGVTVNVGELQLAAAAPSAEVAGIAPLTQAELAPIVKEAVALWREAGLPQAALAKLSQAQFVVATLPGLDLGVTEGNTIMLSQNAAGYGWFIDPAPADDNEFKPSADGKELLAMDPAAVDRIDLLTVVEHELGHIVGLGDMAVSEDLMSTTLGPGVRRDPSALDLVLANDLWQD